MHMRAALAWTLLAIAAGVFIAMLASLWRHQARATFKLVADLKLQPLFGRQPMSGRDVLPDLDCGGKTPGEKPEHVDEVSRMITSGNSTMLASRFEKGFEGLFPKGPITKIPLIFPPQAQQVFGLKLTVPIGAKPGEILCMDVVQRDGNGERILGGIAIEIHVS